MTAINSRTTQENSREEASVTTRRKFLVNLVEQHKRYSTLKILGKGLLEVLSCTLSQNRRFSGNEKTQKIKRYQKDMCEVSV
uniref:BHLH domain-containing protein n=1 Tax=Steinernema glaseri TaxID=37863 RepID=A0A1I7ZXF8_9BILA